MDLIVPSQTVEVTTRAALLKAQGVDVVSFAPGEPDFETPEHIREAAKRALDAGATKYTPVAGTPALRQAVAGWFSQAHGLSVSPEEVMVSTGAKQVVWNAFLAVLSEGDEIIVPAPHWVSYSEIATLCGAKTVRVMARPEEGFVVDPEAVRAAITPRTRALLLASPCNPTGAVFGAATVQALAELAVAHDLWLITDDIYRSLIYGDAHFVQPAVLSPEVRARTIVADGVSKAFAMTGWRIGFALAPPQVITAMVTLQSQSTTNAAAVCQAAALAAITGPTDELEQMRREFDERRRLMLAGLRAIPGATCVEPRGAFYCFPDFSTFVGRRTPAGKVIDGDLGLCQYLLEVAKVAVVPGSAFFGPGFVRFAYATSRANIEKGLARVANALGQLR